MALSEDAEPWYSWRRKSDLGCVKKWSQPIKEFEERFATFASDPAVSPNNTWRDNDVYVSTFMRSGTHFVWHVVRMIVQRSADPIQDLMLESHTCFKLFNEDNKQNDLPVRVLSGHEMPIVLSPEVILNGNRKFICVRRNPKDVITSLSHFIKSNSGICKQITSMDDFIADWCNNGVQMCAVSWYRHVRAWEHFMREHPEAPILAMMYEDFITHPEVCIKKIATFLDIELDAKVVTDIAEATTFNKLRSAPLPDVTKSFGDGTGKPVYYRKGVIGDWRNTLTVAQNEMIDVATERLMEGSGLRFTYN